MTNKKWIELFFSESLEKQINDMILYDVDYYIPYNRLNEYVHTIIDIPYEEYIDYIRNTEMISYMPYLYFPTKNVFSHTDNIIDFFLKEGNRGLKPKDFFHAKFFLFGKNKKDIVHALQAFSFLGLVYEHYGCWYLNCMGYVLNSIENANRIALYARLLLRIPTFRDALLKKDFNLYEALSNIGLSHSRNVYEASSFLFNCIINECNRNRIVCSIKLQKPEIKLSSIIGNNFDADFDDLEKHRIIFDIFNIVKEQSYLSKYDLNKLKVNVLNGDLSSIHILMNVAQRFVLSRSMSFMGKGVSLEDLIIEAELGLYYKILNCKYNSSNFFYHIAHGVGYALQRALLYFPVSFSVSFPTKRECLRIERYVSEFLQKNYFVPTFDMVVDNVDYYDLDNDRCKNYYDFICLEDNYSDGLFETNAKIIENNLNFDFFSSPEEFHADYYLEKEDLKQIIRSVLVYIAKENSDIKRNMEIVCLYFGIGCIYSYSIDAIADKYGLTRERTRQIIEKMLTLIKTFLSDEKKIEKIIYNHYIGDIFEVQIKEGVISTSDYRNKTKNIIETKPRNIVGKKSKITDDAVIISKSELSQKEQESKTIRVEAVFLGLKKLKNYRQRKLIYSVLYHHPKMSIEEIAKKTRLDYRFVKKELFYAGNMMHIHKEKDVYSLNIPDFCKNHIIVF